ncbi:AraC family transcriptional regulator [Nocardiopsis changdeensis]|uniref:AraC family transcriptional regulator n=1 Tax=Nocardiopsis changdeensis TaxID=2831969 RepID=A0ABX8BQW8_9ACTN|nr:MULTISPECIES: AraC family transcriptional regulator [Nocardiopsis]QUX24620.1 AraC family transcriptional regulator [Nocardiopsis changdeensis]QYX35008.1 AraC family transcriptional regulator [Nocardiopsis sp. MT53]
MDVLSDVIGTVRTGRPNAARVEWHSPWGMRFPEVSGVGFQVVLQGSCVLSVEGGEPLHLGVGDIVFLPNGQGHVLAEESASPVRDLCDLLPHGRDADPGAPVTELVCGPQGAGPRFGSAAVGEDGRGRPSCVTLGGSYHTCGARPHPMLSELPRLVHLPARVGARTELGAAVELLGAELDRPRPGGDAIVPSLLEMLLVYILRTYIEENRSAAARGWLGVMRDPAVYAAVQAVHSDPAHPWTVAGLGERAGLSRAAFAKRFTALAGLSPLAYVTWWRLTTAGRMLQENDDPISAIAARVGYSSQFAFANAFKREFGLSPGRYRAGTPLPAPPAAAPSAG